MANWTYNSNDYSARNFAPIPEGDYRVTIADVTEELFNSGNEGFKFTLDVPNHKSKLWYYLVLDPRDSKKTNQRIGMFYDSFAIRDENLSHYEDWIGRDGAVRVRHSQYNGEIKAGVAFCLSRSQQKKFPGFNGGRSTQQNGNSSHGDSPDPQQNRFNGFSNRSANNMGSLENFSF